MVSWLINILGLFLSWYYTELGSESILQGTIFPILVAVFIISLLLKFVFLAGSSGGRGGDGGGFFDGFGGDGDCGGGD